MYLVYCSLLYHHIPCLIFDLYVKHTQEPYSEMGTILSPDSQRCGDGDEKRSMLSLYSDNTIQCRLVSQRYSQEMQREFHNNYAPALLDCRYPKGKDHGLPWHTAMSFSPSVYVAESRSSKPDKSLETIFIRRDFNQACLTQNRGHWRGC